MPKPLQFDQDGQRFYETGVDHGVLFVKSGTGSTITQYLLATSANTTKPLIYKEVNTAPTNPTADDMKYLFAIIQEGVVADYGIVTEGSSVGTYEFANVDSEEVTELPSSLVTDTVYVLTTTSQYADGVAWNGLISVTQSPEGAEAEDIYADNIKYLSLISNETFGGTITAYTYPDEFNECDGNISENGISIGQQTRTAFALAYRTIKSNDNGIEKHKLHLIYGAKAAPSEREYSTVNDSPEAMELSWELNTTPVVIADNIKVNGKSVKPVSHIEIDETTNPEMYAYFEEIVLGSDKANSRLPLAEEIISFIKD